MRRRRAHKSQKTAVVVRAHPLVRAILRYRVFHNFGTILVTPRFDERSERVRRQMQGLRNKSKDLVAQPLYSVDISLEGVLEPRKELILRPLYES